MKVIHVYLRDVKEIETTRRYRMKARAEAAEQTHRDILDATIALWRELHPNDITLEAVAERAGVSVRTIMRRFGSKDGLYEACLQEDPAGIGQARDRVPVGDVEAALTVLLDHYERDGDAVVRMLLLEEQMDFARQFAQMGRGYHRAWCARVFAPFLPPPEEATYPTRLDAFVVATDLYLWKLLRRDVGRSPDETRQAMRLLLDGLIARA